MTKLIGAFNAEIKTKNFSFAFKSKLFSEIYFRQLSVSISAEWNYFFSFKENV